MLSSFVMNKALDFKGGANPNAARGRGPRPWRPAAFVSHEFTPLPLAHLVLQATGGGAAKAVHPFFGGSKPFGKPTKSGDGGSPTAPSPSSSAESTSPPASDGVAKPSKKKAKVRARPLVTAARRRRRRCAHQPRLPLGAISNVVPHAMHATMDCRPPSHPSPHYPHRRLPHHGHPQKADVPKDVPAPVEEAEEEDVYIAERILDCRPKGRSCEYLIKWEGYPDSEASWEPKKNVLDKHLIDDFKEREEARMALEEEEERDEARAALALAEEADEAEAQEEGGAAASETTVTMRLGGKLVPGKAKCPTPPRPNAAAREQARVPPARDLLQQLGGATATGASAEPASKRKRTPAAAGPSAFDMLKPAPAPAAKGKGKGKGKGTKRKSKSPEKEGAEAEDSATAAAAVEVIDVASPDKSDDGDFEAAPVKRKRGRPKKAAEDEAAAAAAAASKAKGGKAKGAKAKSKAAAVPPPSKAKAGLPGASSSGGGSNVFFMNKEQRQRQAEVDAVAAQQQKQLAAFEAVQREKQQRKQVTQTFFQGKAANPFFQQTKDAITQKRALEQQQSDGGGELIDMSGEGGGTLRCVRC